MPNPLNPLEWLKSAQDWFTRTERSSGFRPYLVFLILICGLALALLYGFGDVPEVRQLAIWIVAGSVGGFILMFAIKAFQDPDFCRSETHLHRMKKLELEYMGSETESIPGEIVEDEPAIEAPQAPLQFPATDGVDR